MAIRSSVHDNLNVLYNFVKNAYSFLRSCFSISIDQSLIRRDFYSLRFFL